MPAAGVPTLRHGFVVLEFVVLLSFGGGRCFLLGDADLGTSASPHLCITARRHLCTTASPHVCIQTPLQQDMAASRHISITARVHQRAVIEGPRH